VQTIRKDKKKKVLFKKKKLSNAIPPPSGAEKTPSRVMLQKIAEMKP